MPYEKCILKGFLDPARGFRDDHGAQKRYDIFSWKEPPMADLIDEVGEDLRQQRLQKFWKDNGNWIIGGALFAVLLTGVLHFWRTHQENYDRAETSAIIGALQQGDTQGLIEIAENSDASHAFLARLTAARLQADKGDLEQAIAFYNSVHADKGLQPVYRDLGLLLALSTQLNKKDITQAELEDIVKKLAPLQTEKSVWRYSAFEIGAIAKARLNQKDAALADLSRIIEDGLAPQDLRKRALRIYDDYAAR